MPKSRVRKSWLALGAIGLVVGVTVLMSGAAPAAKADTWKARRDVAIVIVEPPSDRADAALIDTFRSRLRSLQERLDFQIGDRLSPPGSSGGCWGKGVIELDPMTLPAGSAASTGVPMLPGGDRVVASRELSRWASAVDASTSFDGRYTRRIYVVLRGRDRSEGASSPGDVVVTHRSAKLSERHAHGAVDVRLVDEKAVGRALFAVAHELMHTLGAEDRAGRADADFVGAHGWLDVMGVRADGALAGGDEATLRIDDRAAHTIGVP